LPWQRPFRYKKNSVPASTPKTLSFREKIAKIGPADPEIICLREIIKKMRKKKKKEINASKIYSHSGKFAEQAKKLGGLGCHWSPKVTFDENAL